MDKEYHFSCQAGSLGDIVATTAVFKNGRRGSITLTDSPKIRNIAAIFRERAEVKFVPSVTTAMPISGPGPTAKQLLTALDINDYAMPEVTPNPVHVNAAIKWIRDNDIKIPIVVNGTTGGINASNHPLRFYRAMLHMDMQWIINKLISYGVTPITFGAGDTVEKYGGVKSLPNLSIDELMGYYSVIKRYIGCDTGDYHLMLACGGRCEVLIPDNAPHYNYAYHLYTDDCFPPSYSSNDRRRIRVRYTNMKDYKNLFES